VERSHLLLARQQTLNRLPGRERLALARAGRRIHRSTKSESPIPLPPRLSLWVHNTYADNETLDIVAYNDAWFALLAGSPGPRRTFRSDPR